MTALTWDEVGTRKYNTGTDHGVLYVRQDNGKYGKGVAWSGLSGVTETPAGAESSKVYADNIPYLTLISTETFGGTINAYTYPPEFEVCDGTAELTTGVTISQQQRKTFGFVYRVRIGTDTNSEAGYEYHILYGLTASPSERTNNTVNESPEAVQFSWTISSDPVTVTGAKPTSLVKVSTLTTPENVLKSIESALFGSETSEPKLLLPDEIKALH